ncbi:nuclear transport factor 2 family protein [Nocardioides sp. cx-169]|uniref:nuclear transport factor 2 family protein n=1 Tax=Nocardioides sp. cx-169 TaxID=2899080 RepID=UPI001E395179|nr:nuclear transport factor 2 family protein [Nocardioides sp. cx-169]MCD4533001.1 nuclear transport factor 2 family protein [Nocardioides sp. cx-169]
MSSALSAGDRQAIADLVERYAVCFDARDTDGVIGCFTDDVHLDYLDGRKIADGIEEVRATMFQFADVPLPGVDRILHSHHTMRVDRLQTDPAIGDQATSLTSCLAHLLVQDGERTALLTRAVEYDDGHRRTAGGWRIARRRHRQIWEARQPATYLR